MLQLALVQLQVGLGIPPQLFYQGKRKVSTYLRFLKLEISERMVTIGTFRLLQSENYPRHCTAISKWQRR
jgi:hypothetical protein